MSEIFVGRKKNLEELGMDFFVENPEGGTNCYSLIGPNDIGKTMLVKKLAEEFEKKDVKDVYYFDLKIIAEPKNFFWIFWTDLIERMSETITKEKMEAAPKYNEKYAKDILETYAFFNDADQINQMETNAFGMRARRYLDKIFKLYTKLGIHIILTIDEFDLARVAVPEESGDGSFFQWLFSLSPKGTNGLNLSIMLISRRRVGTIAHHMTGGSSIDSAYPLIALRGFNDEELEEYFQTYADLDCGIPSEQEKKGILYFCGRHPGLLMHMRKAISKVKREGELNIAEIFVRQAHMKAIYDRMTDLMKVEFVDRSRTKDCISSFAQAFIGPAYEEQLPSYIERMYDFGFLTRVESGSKDLFELAGMDRRDVLTGEQKKFSYEPLSPYFVEYFKNCVLPDMENNTGALLNHTEIMIRTMILEVLKMKFPDSYEGILGEFAPRKDAYLDNLRNVALRNEASSRNLSFTKLDVMAFNDYRRIIEKYWDDMSLRLSSFASRNQLQEEFTFLNDARNCYAHNNAKVLSLKNVSLLETLCKRICSDIESDSKQQKNLMGKSPIQPVGSRTNDISVQNRVDAMVNSRAIFVCKEVTARKSLRGTLKDTPYKASISKANARNIENPIGHEFEVTILRWDENAQLFNVTL